MRSPIPYNGSHITNLNWFSLEQPETFNAVFGSREGIFSRVIDLSAFFDTVYPDNSHEQLHQGITDRQHLNGTYRFNVPHSFFVQPIFATITDVSSIQNMSQVESLLNPIVGFLAAAFSWDRFLINLLPAGSSSLRCVLSNSCGQQFTYELNGDAVRDHIFCDVVNVSCITCQS
jgi:hypothetical protein